MRLLNTLLVFLVLGIISNTAVSASKLERSTELVKVGMAEKAMLEILGRPVKVYKEAATLKRSAYDFCHYGFVRDYLVRVVTQYGQVVSVDSGDMKAFGPGRKKSAFITEVKGCTKYFNDIDFAKAQRLGGVEKYDIDGLIITTIFHPQNICSFQPQIILQGVIGSDSTFAMESLLARAKECVGERKIQPPVIVRLESGGGLIKDGFSLGFLLRQSGAIATIDDHKECASSCAIAFLGGVQRTLNQSSRILFHAPYYKGRSSLGKNVISCEVPQELLDELQTYYVKMVGEESGKRLYDRTMKYCTASDGWVITGPNAAKLFQIATG